MSEPGPRVPLIALFAATLSTAALCAPASALVVPSVEVTVPKLGASVAGSEVSVPSTTVTVPSVTVPLPTPPVSSPELPAGGEAPSEGTAPPAAPISESGTSAPASPVTSTSPHEPASNRSDPASGASAALSAPRDSPSPSPPSDRARVRSAHRDRSAGAARGAAQRPAGRAGESSRKLRAVRRAKHGPTSPNPLAALGRRLPLPLPVPDWSKPIILLLLALALSSAVRARLAGRRARLLDGQRAELLADLKAMQAALVPSVPAQFADLAVSVAYRPADDAPAGGDFYDVFELESGRVCVILGDVCGHGRDALEHAALTRYTVRAYLQAGLEPRAALGLAGHALADPTCAHYATLIAGVYDESSGRFTYANAGHPAPIVLDAGPGSTVEVCGSPPVGWAIPTGRRQSSLSLPAGAVMCLFTDGLTEARCGNGLLGEGGLKRLLGSLGPQPDAHQLLGLVSQEAGATPDDMAACILRSASTSPPRPRVEELEADSSSLERGELTRFLEECGVTVDHLTELLARAGELLGSHAAVLVRVVLSHDGASACVLGPSPASSGVTPGALAVG